MTSTATELTATCSLCEKTIKAKAKKGGDIATPRRWKQTQSGLLCADCVGANYVRRSVRLRLMGTHESEEREQRELYLALNMAAEQCGAFANWYSQLLWTNDPAQEWKAGTEKKFPAMPNVDFYAAGTILFSAIAPSALCQLAQTVRSYYCSDRFGVIAKQERSVRSYRRFDLPIPVHGQSWDISTDAEGAIKLRFQVGPGKRWACRAFADPDNLRRIRQILSGEAETGTLTLIKRRRQNLPGEAGKQAPRSWYVRISGLFPRVSARKKEATATLAVRHTPEALWHAAVIGSDAEPMIYHADELRERIIGHAKRDERRQVDNSVTYRHVSKRTRKRRAAKRGGECAKHAAGVTAQINLACAVLVGWCLSKNVAVVRYDGGKWLESFAYSRLLDTLRSRLENHGIELAVTAPEPSPDGTSAALAEPTRETDGDA